MSRTIELLTAIEASIKAHFGSEVKTVKIHGGRFSLDDLKKIPTKAPAIYIGLLRLTKAKNATCSGDRDAFLVASVITKDVKAKSRHISVIELSEKLSRLIEDNNWNLDFVDTEDEVTVQNFYSNNINTTGVAIYGLSWTQQVRLD